MKLYHVPQSLIINYHLKNEVSITVSYVQPVTQQYESRTVRKIQIATMKNTDGLHFEGKPSHATAKLTSFAVSKDEWETKEDTGKSMKNELYILRYAKRHLSGQSNVEQ